MSDGMDTARMGPASNGMVTASDTGPANGIIGAGSKTIQKACKGR
jgi:hypothetical protein